MHYGERFNFFSHLSGTVLAAAGLAALVTYASLHGDVWQVVSFSIYGSTLLLLYLTSTLYHALSGRAKAVFQRLDHCAIYLLIAGSYTPFTLVTLRGPWGWTLFGINWALAVIGIVQELLIGQRTRLFSMLIYVVMGWLIVFATGPLIAGLETAGLAWLAAGGVIYSAGIYFFLNDERIRHGHGIWHLFVLAGSICQFISIIFYVN